MKNLVIALLSLLCSAAFGQCIVAGQLINYEGSNIIKITKPINGFFNSTLTPEEKYMVKKDGSFKIAIDCRKPVFVVMSFSGQPVYLLVGPNDSIHVRMIFPENGTHDKVKYIFSSSNWKFHQRLYDYCYYPTEKYEGIWEILKKDNADTILRSTTDILARQTKPFNDLADSGFLPVSYLKLIKGSINSMLLTELIRRLGDGVYYKGNRLPESDRYAIIQKLFSLYPPVNEASFYGLNAGNYAVLYYDFMRSRRLKTGSVNVQPDSTVTFASRDYQITGPFVPILSIKNDSLREFLFSSKLAQFIRHAPLYALKDEISYMRAYFRSSPYLATINYCLDNPLQRPNDKQDEDGSPKYFSKVRPLILDSSGRIANFSFSREKQLTGRYLYIDIWATWCGPCLEEMRFNYRLDSLLYSLGIVRVYVSIDKRSDINKWYQYIDRLHLGGYHVLASDSLISYIQRHFMVGKPGIAIPRYILLRDDQILIPDARRPDDLDKLKDQLLESVNEHRGISKRR